MVQKVDNIKNINIRFLDELNKNFDKNKLKEISVLNLAYLGDSIFETFVRYHLIKDYFNKHVGDLHKISQNFVNAPSQSKMYKKIFSILTEEEVSIIKRGKNAKIQTKPKSATMLEYKNATGLEVLFGYLFLKGDILRLSFLFNECIK